MKLLYSSTSPPLLFVPLVPLPLLYPLRTSCSSPFQGDSARAVSQFKENCPPGRGTSVESVSERSGGGGISTTMGKPYFPSCTPSALRARPPARGTVLTAKAERFVQPNTAIGAYK